MSAMSSNERATLVYTGDLPVELGGHNADPVPRVVHPGGTVEVNASVLEHLLSTGRFTVEGAAPPELAGKQLDDALREAGLPLTGTADEKRQRLAAHHQDPDGADGDDGNPDDTEQE